jgi:tetratricopeptide (TPR) repeat protein
MIFMSIFCPIARGQKIQQETQKNVIKTKTLSYREKEQLTRDLMDEPLVLVEPEVLLGVAGFDPEKEAVENLDFNPLYPVAPEKSSNSYWEFMVGFDMPLNFQIYCPRYKQNDFSITQEDLNITQNEIELLQDSGSYEELLNKKEFLFIQYLIITKFPKIMPDMNYNNTIHLMRQIVYEVVANSDLYLEKEKRAAEKYMELSFILIEKEENSIALETLEFSEILLNKQGIVNDWGYRAAITYWKGKIYGQLKDFEKQLNIIDELIQKWYDLHESMWVDPQYPENIIIKYQYERGMEYSYKAVELIIDFIKKTPYDPLFLNRFNPDNFTYNSWLALEREQELRAEEFAPQ